MLSRLKRLVSPPVGCAALAMTVLVSGCGGGPLESDRIFSGNVFSGSLPKDYPIHGIDARGGACASYGGALRRPLGLQSCINRHFRNLRLRFNYRSQMSQITVTHPSIRLRRSVRGSEL